MEAELTGAETDLKNDVSRQVFGQALTDGTNLQTGVIATLSADPGTGTTLTFANEPTSVLRHFFKGMVIQAVNPSGGAVRSGGPYTVLSVSLANKTVTTVEACDASIGSADYIVRSGTEGTPVTKTNFANEINGLRFLISSTAKYAGIDPANEPAWAAVAVGSSTTGISEVVLDQAAEGVETDGDGSTPSLYVAEHAQRRKLASQLQAQKRYDGRETTLKAGWVGLQIARGTLVADRYCPSTSVFGINPSEFVRFVGLDWSWDDDDGKVLMKALDGSDAVEARFKSYQQLVTPNRNEEFDRIIFDLAHMRAEAPGHEDVIDQIERHEVENEERVWQPYREKQHEMMEHMIKLWHDRNNPKNVFRGMPGSNPDKQL
jgi:hypothetical protein